ncbi:MAG: GSCFA domain-containing protein [Rubellimicrobium sp.]|nr:GSCFA domain-containing protein [Rubellimicrobium sp.]
MHDVNPHPYASLPTEAFWKTGVVKTDRAAFPDLYRPTVMIGPRTAIATAGSCFAQHIARALRAAGCSVLDAEPAPAVMPDAVAQAHGYRLFSVRTGNIYTARFLREFLEDCASGHVDPRLVCTRGGRFVDALRPGVEPAGLGTAAEVILHREYHLERSARMLAAAEVLVFTPGLTEAWLDRETGRVLPLCPGVAGGRFDPACHVLVEFTTAEVLDDLRAIRAILQRFRPGMRMILTVSPVPLTATASGRHVLEATVGAKSVLRAAVGQFVTETAGADYFPSYEFVTHPATGGPWFAPNLRSVSVEGVARVMQVFLAAHGITPAEQALMPGPELDEEPSLSEVSEDPPVCDELLLQAFGR